MTILLLGASGYVGKHFLAHLQSLNINVRPVARRDVDYSNRSRLVSLIRESSATFLINCAGYTGKPNVDACELHKTECLAGNAVLPGIIADACDATGIAWGHVSSGCIFTGSRPDGSGFTESDTPNFSFRTDNCSFYSGCKALGEEILAGRDNVYIWRLRIPFSHQDCPRNYISKVMKYQRLLDARNSISQLDEFVAACWQTWARRVPFGTYNITNPGSITTHDVVDMIRREWQLNREFHFFRDEAEFMAVAAKTPRSNCVMDSSKLLSTGIQLTPVEDAVIQALRNWIPSNSSR